MEIVADLKQDNLVDHYAGELPPDSYRSHPMVENQIRLVGGTQTWLQRVVTNEWRARTSRSRWATENPTWHEKINRYDDRLAEEWYYKHTDMCVECVGQSEYMKTDSGRDLLKWSFYEAPNQIEHLAPSVTAPSYVRGAFHVLSVSGRVGWHPEYKKLLGFDK